MKALHKAAIIMKIALRFRKAIFGAPNVSKYEPGGASEGVAARAAS